MIDILSKILHEMQFKRDTVLVSIVENEGSTPRGAGSMMLVGENGRLVGTIGGGKIEFLSTQKAAECLTEKTSGVQAFDLAKNAVHSIGMVCGGNAKVFFQFLPGEDAGWQELIAKAGDGYKKQEDVWFVQYLDGKCGCLIDSSGKVLAGELRGEIGTAALKEKTSVETEGAFLTPFIYAERAVIFGAGHIAQALCPILASVGFRPVIYDDRPEYAVQELFPKAEQVLCGSFDAIGEQLELGQGDYAVVVTSGHASDFEAEQFALQADPAYVGVIGSRAKTAHINGRLRECGVTQERIEFVHTPIGLSIGAVTPEEIAVSIASEMIQVRAERRKKQES